jgi:hypothetical protein
LGELAGSAVTEEKQAALQAIVSPLSTLKIKRNCLVQVELEGKSVQEYLHLQTIVGASRIEIGSTSDRLAALISRNDSNWSDETYQFFRY